MEILVTGGAGYIGTHLCLELLHSGYEVIVVDNFSNSSKENYMNIGKITDKKITTYNLDLLDAKKLEKVFDKNRIDAVIHLAGYKSIEESITDPLKYYENNISGTLNLLKVMKKYSVYNLVFSSSATVYGNFKKVPLVENEELNPTNPYGRSKFFIEEILRDLCISNNSWSIAVLRYFNPVGAHESGFIGENPRGKPNNLLPIIARVALKEIETLKVFGVDYPTNDGTGVRDYIHVCDLSAGHVKAIQKVLINSGFEPYNLGTGKGTSVFEILETIERVSGGKVPYSIEERRKGDIAESYANPSKALNELGWTAKKSINEICEDLWRWETNRIKIDSN